MSPSFFPFTPLFPIEAVEFFTAPFRLLLFDLCTLTRDRELLRPEEEEEEEEEEEDDDDEGVFPMSREIEGDGCLIGGELSGIDSG